MLATSYVFTEEMDEMPNVNVKEAGNPNNGTITDASGKFTLNVPSTAWLEFSHVGYETIRVLASELEGAVYMEQIAEEIPGVTITGSGKKDDKTLMYVLFGAALLVIGYFALKTNSEVGQTQRKSSRQPKKIKA